MAGAGVDAREGVNEDPPQRPKKLDLGAVTERRLGWDDFLEAAGDAAGVLYSSSPVGKTVLYNLSADGDDKHREKHG